MPAARTEGRRAAPSMLHDQATLLLCVRHGETAWNALQRIQGHTDIALNERGLGQAAALAAALAGQELQAVYSSDLQRARQTAAELARQRGLPLRTDARLRERAFGDFEGHRFADLQALHPLDCERWRRRDPQWAAPGGGEALEQVQGRVVAALRDIASRHRGHSVALVSHGGVLDCLYRLATGQPIQAPRSWELRNAAINRLLLSEDRVSLIGWNDCSHLEAAADEAAD